MFRHVVATMHAEDATTKDAYVKTGEREKGVVQNQLTSRGGYQTNRGWNSDV